MSRWIVGVQLLSVVNFAGWGTAQAQHTTGAEFARNAYLDDTARRLIQGVRAAREAAARHRLPTRR